MRRLEDWKVRSYKHDVNEQPATSNQKPEPRNQQRVTSYVGCILCTDGATWHKSNAAEYKAIVEKLGPKLKCVHQQYKSMKAKFPISIFNVP